MSKIRVDRFRLLFKNSLRPVSLDDFEREDWSDIYKHGVVTVNESCEILLEMIDMSQVHTIAKAITFRWKKASLPCPIFRLQCLDSQGRFLFSEPYNNENEWGN
jgi:hypothetical protein